jgi:hypothetical protein
MSKYRLSKAQERALAKLAQEWQSAYDLQESITTLDALVGKGFAARKVNTLGSMFSPRTSCLYRRHDALADAALVLMNEGKEA